MAFYFTYIFALAVVLYPSETQSLEISECEKKYMHKCSMEYAKVWQKEEDNRDVLQVHCDAYQTWERCLASTAKSCKGVLLDANRMLIVEHMIFDKKTGICPNHDYKALEKLVQVDEPGRKMTSEMQELDTDPVDICVIKENKKCAVKIAETMRRNMKKKICHSTSIDEIFRCYETHFKKCKKNKKKILTDYIKSLENFGRVVQGYGGYWGLFAYC